MSEQKAEEETKVSFTDVVKPPKDYDAADPEPQNTDIITEDTPVDTELQKQIQDELTKVGLENLRQLCLKNEFEIGGKTYTGQKLTPKAMKELRRAEKDFQNAIKGSTDPDFFEDQRMALLAIKAMIHLGMTDLDFQDTDVPMLSTVITAREMRARGWFRAQ